jgi:hypothetical protein
MYSRNGSAEDRREVSFAADCNVLKGIEKIPLTTKTPSRNTGKEGR